MLPVIIVIGQTLNPHDGIWRGLSGGAWSDYKNTPFVNYTASCQVRNSNALVKYMVPFRSASEWNSFKNASLSLADLSYNCATACTPKTCADKVGLAEVNQGFNCGLVSDGCGTIISCTSNCAANEICAVGADGSDCSLGQLHMCDQAEYAGHCRVDNGCFPVVDLPALGGAYGRMGCLSSGPYQYRGQACSAGLGGVDYPALYYRNTDCFVGSMIGGNMNACSSYFYMNLYDFYHIIDANTYTDPYISYSYLGIPSGIQQCPPPNDSGETCYTSPCYMDCKLVYDDGYCEGFCQCIETAE